MSDPATPFTPKANANTFGSVVSGFTRNHTIPIVVMKKFHLIQEFLKLPDGGKSIFYFDSIQDNGQYISRSNNEATTAGDPEKILNSGTKDIGLHKAYRDAIDVQLTKIDLISSRAVSKETIR